MLKKIVYCVFVFLSILNFNFSYGQQEKSSIKNLDSIVAIVDQEVITEKELEEKINSVINNLKSQKIEILSESILRKQVLERLIANSIQVQLAYQTGLKINDTQEIGRAHV